MTAPCAPLTTGLGTRSGADTTDRATAEALLSQSTKRTNR